MPTDSCYRCPVCLGEFGTREEWEAHKGAFPDHAAEAGVRQTLAGMGFRMCDRCGVAIVGKGICVRGQHIHEACATPEERAAWGHLDVDTRDILTGNTDPRLVGLPVIGTRRREDAKGPKALSEVERARA